MATMQSLLDEARKSLNDDSKTRYPDSDLLLDANNAVSVAFSIRPDLRYGSYPGTFADLGTASTFPLPLEYRPAVVAYIVGKAQEVDDEFVNTGSVDHALKEYYRGLGVI